jgi:hypothetical protein
LEKTPEKLECRRNSHAKPDRLRAFMRGFNHTRQYNTITYTTWQSRGNDLRFLKKEAAMGLFDKEWDEVKEANMSVRGRLDPWNKGKLK